MTPEGKLTCSDYAWKIGLEAYGPDDEDPADEGMVTVFQDPARIQVAGFSPATTARVLREVADALDTCPGDLAGPIVREYVQWPLGGGA